MNSETSKLMHIIITIFPRAKL